MVCLVVLIFLFHWRSAVSILLQLPITIAISFILLDMIGLSSNLMSLTGIALAIGVVVDNGIIMSENAYRNLSDWQNAPEPPEGAPAPATPTISSPTTSAQHETAHS